MDAAITADGLSKQYLLRHEAAERYATLREAAMAWPRQFAARFRSGPRDAKRIEEFWALRDVSFEVARGDRLGIIGRNGAGKSTLLKLLSRITHPTRGSARIRGRLASLLEVGTGFHPELTGRENIFLNGAILGMTRNDIQRRFDQIVDFAEVERFLDTPVKRYSSGMYMRLAFSVAAHLEPDVLIVDEVLAVGDAQFQKKCIGKMAESGREGRTVLFVSHNMGAIAELCTRAILLSDGAKVEDGPIAQVIERYVALGARGSSFDVQQARAAHLPCEIMQVRVTTDDGVDAGTIDIAQALAIELEYEVRERLHGLQIVVVLRREGVALFQTFDTDTSDDFDVVDPGRYRLRHSLPGMFLKAGSYGVQVLTGTPARLIQDLPEAAGFVVEELSVNTSNRGYRRERIGQIVSPGVWQKLSVEPSEDD